ncbi:hypothetical protein [Pararhizobium sp.]|uniref:hypothetical protein n=1 Tax=Pararhizobium sp. TaxID=1977563 RepID=UPI003BABC9AC
MNILKDTVANHFPGLIALKKVYAALSLACHALFRPEPWPRFLQHIRTAAKKCPFLAPRSLDSEATVVFTPSNARPGSAKLFGFPHARDLMGYGRADS